jgi:hypothetical protein
MTDETRNPPEISGLAEGISMKSDILSTVSDKNSIYLYFIKHSRNYGNPESLLENDRSIY